MEKHASFDALCLPEDDRVIQGDRRQECTGTYSSASFSRSQLASWTPCAFVYGPRTVTDSSAKFEMSFSEIMQLRERR